MGRNKYTAREIEIIGKLLDKKCSGNRLEQKELRHKLRTQFEFNISDFGEQGKSFTRQDLERCVERGVIKLLAQADAHGIRINGETKSKVEYKEPEPYKPVFGIPPHKKKAGSQDIV